MSKLKKALLVVPLAVFCFCIIANYSSAADSDTNPQNWFNKLGVGGAIGWNHNLGQTRVDGASVVNGIVRVDAKHNDSVRTWVEVHAWFLEWGGTEEKPKWGLGPFVAVAPGSNFVDAVAMGAMLGRKYQTEAKNNLSFNISIGGALEPNVKVLGDGIAANQPLPAGETTARTQTTSVGSLLIMFSVGWDAFAKTGPEPEKPAEKPAAGNTPAAENFTISEPIFVAQKKDIIGPQLPGWQGTSSNY